jgi:putative membrane-bound dehydrogenase-like protein
MRTRFTGSSVLAWLALAAAAVGDVPKVPEGFEARLVASVPAVEFPCQVATAPDGALFVAEDPMDQVGPYEAFDGRIRLFREGREPVLFAEGFRAIQGMAWRDGALYVCHMPFLTVVRDTDGDDRADTKDDLFKDLGPTDNKGLNDHIVSGIQFGMDGWLYISVGDKGVPGATRPEDGRKVQLKGGGVLRCRPDGTELEVFSSGTRNHLEANLDAADHLFTYDNTDDGDGWWTRVTHHIDGGYYGYPYDYHDRPDRFLNRMAEYGGGSPCGAVFYRDDVWPEPYRNIGLWAEWGKGKVHAFRFRPKGASFEVAEAIDFAVPDGLNAFHPIDLALSHDGRTLYVADWNMGGWGNRNEKVGRVWAIAPKNPADSPPRGSDADSIEQQIGALEHPAYNERMRAQARLIKEGRDALPKITYALAGAKTPALARRHLIWALDAIAGGTPEATLPLLDQLSSPEADLRAQAARALGQRRAPLGAVVDRLMEMAREERDPPARLEAIIALGRIGQPQAVPALLPVLADDDPYIAFTARVALRRIGDWNALAGGLRNDDPKVREGTLLALEQQYQRDAVDVLIGLVHQMDLSADERAKALRFAVEVHRKPKPWDGRWWGTRPSQGRPPAKVDEWEGTEPILNALRAAIGDPASAVRLAAVEGVRATRDDAALPILAERFDAEPDAEVRAAVARTLGTLGYEPALPRLIESLRNGGTPDAVREAALDAVAAIGTPAALQALIDLLGGGKLPAERQPRVIGALGRAKAEDAVPRLVELLESPSPDVRAASAEALGRVGKGEDTLPPLRARLDDSELAVRKAAIGALAALRDREAVPALIEAAEQEATRVEATQALAALATPKALRVYLRGLADRNPDLRRASARAVAVLRDEAVPLLEQLAERRELPPSVVTELRRIYAAVEPIRRWKVLGPFARDAAPELDPDAPIDLKAQVPAVNDRLATWTDVRPVDRQGQIDLGRFFGGDQRVAYGYAEYRSFDARRAEMVVGSDDTLTVWLNGRKVYDFESDRGFTHEQDRFEVELADGVNRVLVRSGNSGGGWQFAVGLSTAPKYAFLNAPAAEGFNPEEYAQFALDTPGDAGHGRTLFADPKALACTKCHKVGDEGGAVGPDLTGIGSKYARAELIESVLYPSAKIFSGYEPVVVATSDGRVVTGILKSDDDQHLILQDAEAQTVTIPKSEIDERRTGEVSLMPNGLAEGLSKQDFADLIAYLVSLKDPAAGAAR